MILSDTRTHTHTHAGALPHSPLILGHCYTINNLEKNDITDPTVE